MLFSNRDLKKLIIPLIIEQVLALTIGIFDTMMVSQCGQSAVSGVSIVDGLNVLIINIFSALATGGAVVCSQYIGKKDEKMACHSAKQLLFTILSLSLVIMVLCMIFNGNLLNLIFGHIESDVMAYARKHRNFSFRQLLERQSDKLEVVVTFLAILELMKIGEIHLTQEHAFDDMYIEIQEAEGEETELLLEDLGDLEG